MKPEPNKPNRRAEWYSKAGAYEQATQMQMWPFWMLFIVMMQPAVGGLWALCLLPLLAPLTLLGPRHQAIVKIHKLRVSVPWFAGEPVTVGAMPRAVEFDKQLAKHKYEAIHLDGTAIRSWQDLATQLQDRTERMKWPADYREKVCALLTYLATEKPRQRAVIWHDAATSAKANPSLVPTLISDWAARAIQLPPGLLVFIDMPETQETDPPNPEQVLHRNASGEAPDRSILKDAPEGAWWTPVPGELTK